MPGRCRVGHVVQEGPGHAAFIEPGARCGRPFQVQREQRGRTVDHRRRTAVVVSGRVADQGGEAGRVEGRRHGDEREVSAQLADFGEHADEQVCLQPAFVDFIEDHGIGALKAGVREQAAQQDPRGHELDHGARAGLAFPADRVAHTVADPGAVQGGQAPRGRADSHAARLGDDNPRTPGTPASSDVGEQRRDQRRLACARRSLHHRGRSGTPVLQRRGEIFQRVRKGQARPDAAEVKESLGAGRVQGCGRGSHASIVSAIHSWPRRPARADAVDAPSGCRAAVLLNLWPELHACAQERPPAGDGPDFDPADIGHRDIDGRCRRGHRPGRRHPRGHLCADVRWSRQPPNHTPRRCGDRRTLPVAGSPQRKACRCIPSRCGFPTASGSGNPWRPTNCWLQG